MAAMTTALHRWRVLEPTLVPKALGAAWGGVEG
jgi:hypothetical protein